MRIYFLLLFVPALASAQPLSRFLEAAEVANLDVQLQAANHARSSAEAGQVWGGLLPAVTASGAFVRNQYKAEVAVPAGPTSSDTITIAPLNQLDGSLRVEVPLIDVNRWLQTSSALATVRAAEQREQGTRAQVRREVVLSYYSAAGAQALLEAATQSLQVARAQAEQQQARAAAGVATELELVRASAEIQRNEQVIADARALEANARRTLFSLTSVGATVFPALTADDLHLEAPLAELEGSVPGLPGVRAAEEDAKAAKQTQLAAATALIPRLDAQFTQRFTNATGFSGQTAAWNAGATFSWRLDAPIVQGIRAASAREQISALTAAKARLAATDQLHSDWQRTIAAASKQKAAQAQVVAARRAAALASERNAAGVATQLDLISADRDRLQAEVNDIMARYELASARACLRLSTGRPPEVTP